MGKIVIIFPKYYSFPDRENSQIEEIMAYLSRENVIKMLAEELPNLGQEEYRFERSRKIYQGIFGKLEADGILTLKYKGSSYQFLVEISDSSNPLSFQITCEKVLALSRTAKTPVLMVIPFINESIQKFLTNPNIEINVIDLCGNAHISTPELRIIQKGEPNKFPESRKIKNPYRGNSSLVARAFLKKRIFNSVGAVRDEILSEDLSLSLPAVSKALSELENDLIVLRGDDSIFLADEGSLLENLRGNYQLLLENELEVRIDVDFDLLPMLLYQTAQESNTLLCATGRTSYSRYSGGASNASPEFYVDEDPVKFLKRVKESRNITWTPQKLFSNLKLIQPKNKFVYFDRQPWMNSSGASKVQAFLELSYGDPRERKIALEIKDLICHEIDELRQE